MNCAACECGRQKRLFVKKGQNFVKCLRCGLVFIEALTSGKETEARYDKEYFLPWGPDGRLSNVTRRNKIYTFQMRLDDIEKYSSGKKILDIGCAMGLFLEAAQMRGWDPYGIEVSEYAANIAKDKFGSRVTIGKLEDTDFPPESFDVVTMFDVIEHMLLPVEPLQRILKILRPQGLLAISTINTESLSCKLMRLAWPHFKSEHANYFSPFNIKLVLDRAGFRILEIKDSKKFLSLGYVKSYFDSYGMPFAATFLNLFSIVIPAALRDYPFKTRLGEMLVLARKIG